MMVERSVQILNKNGLHARPAAEIVKAASKFKSDITISREDIEVNGKSIMGVMMLAAECGSTILVRTNRADPAANVADIWAIDVAGALAASIARPEPGAVWNVADDEPAPPQDVIAYAAELLGLPVPPEVPFERAELSPMARSFYAESKRVSNRRLRERLGVVLRHPNYRMGLRAILAAGG